MKKIALALIIAIAFSVGMIVGYSILQSQQQDIIENRLIFIIMKEEDLRKELEKYEPDKESVEAIAKTLYGECRGVESEAEKAAVAWVILNRIDAGFGDTVLEVVSEPEQFYGYDESHPVLDDLAYIAKDVMTRWQLEKEGVASGRVIPADYLWFHGDGEHNYFRNVFRTKQYWDWSLENPYGD